MYTKKVISFFLVCLLTVASVYKLTIIDSYSFTNPQNITISRICIVSSNDTVLLKKTVFPALCSSNTTIMIDKLKIVTEKNILTKVSAKDLSLKEVFKPLMSVQEKLIYLYVFQSFIDMCRQYNITYFLFDGSLIGAYRHHGFVPWDDDVDIFVNASQKQKLINASQNYSSKGFNLYTKQGFQWKFYHKTLSKGYSHRPFRWPYIDIFFWIVSNDNFYDFTYNRKARKTDLKLIFPLKSCLFEGLLLPCPANSKKFLSKIFNTKICKTNSFSHKHEVYIPWQKSVACNELKNLFPFASHE